MPLIELILLLSSLVDASPTHRLQRRAPRTDVLGGANFPDPTLLDDGGKTYAFATVDGAGHQVPVTSSDDFNTWSAISESFPSEGVPAFSSWAAPNTVWAPDVNKLDDYDGSYAMYYSPALSSNGGIHCIGLARSANIAGPYNDSSTEPWICPQEQGGAIDAAGFLDDDGKRYVLYKVDGPAAANGGYCANHANTPSTPIMIQPTQSDGYTKIGDPVEIYNNNGVDDRYQTEAPSLIKGSDGTYFLFFSTGCYDDNSYTTSYATSTNGIFGPYEDRQILLKNGDYDQFGPGGMDIALDGSGRAVYHSLKADNDISQGRVMNTAIISLSGRSASIN
ncbi:Extracellular endo-alpha-(1-_5)-L-arabinanase 1 [Pseudocercospora fuligena]|uniref:Extracellular endo-alpha-(1->5)-L-arabinanase 1 n=1 Tax=Pseudocercospora fuligena TaxID=685502 RepID=A0A8H6RK97_9PEZI|nr:Extracellular endo-alpha-(1->5)-L-arabinanase 1 [Pseudocercospora fuligena]